MLLFNDGVGITLWLAVDGKLFTVSLVARERAREKDEKRRKVNGTESKVDAGLAMRIHVYSQCDYVPRKKKRKKEARGVKVKVIYCVHE